VQILPAGQLQIWKYVLYANLSRSRPSSHVDGGFSQWAIRRNIPTGQRKLT
jgi:hypothetical protein